MAPQRSASWMAVIGALVVGAALAGVAGWRVSLQALEHRIKEKHSSLKKLTLSGGIPPNQEVMDYLTSREASLEQRYQHWLKRATVQPVADASSADPQLYFQERLHEVQRTLERLAAARTMSVPEQLGFPKELPPSDTVPRLLVQLSLMQELAELLFEQGVVALSSLKIEDPETVPEEGGEGAFLMRLPVRVRLTATLPQLMRVLGAVERAKLLIDVRSLRVVSAPTPETENLEAELLVARYLMLAAAQEPTGSAEPESAPAKKGTSSVSRGARPSDLPVPPKAKAETATAHKSREP